MRELSVQKQQGVAIITVMLVAALVTVIVTQIGNTTYMSRRITSNMLQSDQALYYAYGAEELAMGLLKLSLEKEDGNNVVHLGQSWANPAGLNFPIEEGEKGNLEMVGYVKVVAKDKHACLNLNAILNHTRRGGSGSGSGSGTGSGPTGSGSTGSSGTGTGTNTGTTLGANITVDEDPSLANTRSRAEEVFEKLLNLAGVAELEVQPIDLAAAVRDWIDADTNPSSPGGAEDNEYLGLEKPYRTANSYFGSISELLVIKGFNKKIFDKIKPLVCAIPVNPLNRLAKPDYYQINVNTLAPDQAAVLAAVYGSNVTLAMAQQIINDRPEGGYNQGDYDTALSNALGGAGAPQLCDCAQIIFKSELFEISIDTGYGRGRAKINALVQGNAGSGFKVVSRYFGEPI